MVNADNSNPSDIYLYDAAAKSWSDQKVNLAGLDPSSMVSILDHDTNVFC